MSEESLLCSKCGEIPEILNAHTDNGKIEIKCKKCGVYEILIDDYYKELSNKKYFEICNYCEKEDIYYYCTFCKKNYCKQCQEDYHSNHECFKVNEKKTKCFNHNKKFKYFCFDDQENLCEDDKNDHKNHKIMEISKVIDNRNLINNNIDDINKQLENLIEINDLILHNEEYFIKSIKNIGKSFEEGNKRDSKDIKYLLNGLSKDIEISMKAIEKLKDKYKIQLYRKNKYLHLYNSELKDEGFKYISQIAFNQLKEIDISKNQIKDIKPFNKMSLPFLEFLNLSYNEIENIEPVAKLKSLNLKYIFLQRNKIEDIEPFLQSYFPSLKILRVEDNNINGENEQDEQRKKKKKEIFGEVKKKFSDKFIYKFLKEQLNEFIKKYNLGIYKSDPESNQKNDEINIQGEVKSEVKYQLISEEGNTNKIYIDKDKNNIFSCLKCIIFSKNMSEKDVKNSVKNSANNSVENNVENSIENSVENIVENIVNIDLSDKKGGDEMLKYLFLIITYANKNKIEKLILRNNYIKDASILARINLRQLKKLDLSVNEIKDSNFLKDLKADNLVNLYLDNNYFRNFYPILNVDVNEILNSKILSKIEENEFKELYKESEENRSKDVKPLLTAKFKKLKILSVNNQNVSDNNNNNYSNDDDSKKKQYATSKESAVQIESTQI